MLDLCFVFRMFDRQGVKLSTLLKFLSSHNFELEESFDLGPFLFYDAHPQVLFFLWDKGEVND